MNSSATDLSQSVFMSSFGAFPISSHLSLFIMLKDERELVGDKRGEGSDCGQQRILKNLLYGCVSMLRHAYL